nr:hypothetical protein [Actinomycetales bacterium]
PGQSDVPKGEVTLSEGAGSLGPWLAHRVFAGSGQEIAAKVRAALTASEGAAGRVLVTANPNLLDSDVHSQLLLSALERRATELDFLANRIRTAVSEIDSAVGGYRSQEAGTGAGQPGIAAESTEEGDGAATAGTPVATAVDLLRLLSTDVTLTPVVVSADASLLAILTAGALAGTVSLDVVLDGFETGRTGGRVLTALGGAREASRTAAERALELAGRVAPVEQELAQRIAALEAAEASWRDAVAATDVEPVQVAQLAARREALSAQVSARAAALGPAKAVLEGAVTLLEAARAEFGAAAATDESGSSPIARAVAREALHDPVRPITHVLYVQPAHSGADVVTRRSLLGASARVSYLGAANTAWVLFSVEGGTLLAGGSTDGVDQFTHDLTTGGSALVRNVPNAEVASLGADPFAEHEKTLRTGVFVFAIGVALLGVAAMLGVVLPPILALWR